MLLALVYISILVNTDLLRWYSGWSFPAEGKSFPGGVIGVIRMSNSVV